MQAVIMAGGKGTRLAALTKDEIPKPMVEVAGKPLLLWQVERLKDHGITGRKDPGIFWRWGAFWGTDPVFCGGNAPGHRRFLLLFKGYGGGDLLHDVRGPVF